MRFSIASPMPKPTFMLDLELLLRWPLELWPMPGGFVQTVATFPLRLKYLGGHEGNSSFEDGYLARIRPFYIWLAEDRADELGLWGVEMLSHVGVHFTLEHAGAGGLFSIKFLLILGFRNASRTLGILVPKLLVFLCQNKRCRTRQMKVCVRTSTAP